MTSLMKPEQEAVAPSAVETASTAVATQARAQVEARYVMAMRNPRSWNQVRVKILETCRRSSFAAVAKFSKPTGGKQIVGPSIRFAEEVARQMGNILAETVITFDDAERRIVRVMVTDLESNVSYPQDIILDKTVERKSKADRVVLAERTNKSGQTVYVVEATEDELAVKQGAQVSKALRNNILRILPGDILDEAMDQVAATVKSADAADPAAARKKLCDAFFDLGIMPEQLEEFLGKPLEQINPGELQLLRNIYTGIREGEGTWAEVMERRSSGAPTTATTEAPKANGGTSALKDRLKQKPMEAPAAAAAPPEGEDPDLDEDRRIAAADRGNG